MLRTDPIQTPPRRATPARPAGPARTALRGLTLALALVPLLALPAAADWLVMVDGTRVETDGPWSERGKLVVFTDASGNFVSLRRADVDLDASRRATEEATVAKRRPAPAPTATVPRPSVMRLTDDDVAHVDDYDASPSATSDAGSGGDASEEASQEEAPSPTVAVAAWERDATPGGDGIQVRATLENPSSDAAIGISVNVTLYDDEGGIVATAPGRLAASGLMPGQRTELVAVFPGVFDFSAVDFAIDQRAVRARSADQAPSAEEEPDLDQDLDSGEELEEFDESV